MARLAALLALLLTLGPAPLAARTLAVSPAPERVAVTVYRDPNRGPFARLNHRWLNGFALISETRSIDIPAGESEIRFEGVAGGIIPQSAIVTGIPEGILERNRDARLLSPGTLLDASLGRRVHLRRTSRATGEVREHEALVRSGADGAVVLETGEGFEALRCTGLAETVRYDSVPEGLSARPTLSVRTRSSRPVRATVTLSYLAVGFDWQANYVARLSEAGDRLDLFAWLTLANGDETGFRDAETQAVAGRLNRRHAPVPAPDRRPLTLECWPDQTTSDVPALEKAESIVVTGSRVSRSALAPPPPPPPPPPPAAPTAAMIAEQEELGDLKLYRIPEPVTVAARSQKQVALLERTGVQAQIVHRTRIGAGVPGLRTAARRVLVARNGAADGLGLPLPAGGLVLFAEHEGRQILIGEGALRDRAVGDDVEVEIGEAPGVQVRLDRTGERGGAEHYELVVTNDQARPIRFEAELDAGGTVSAAERLGRRSGRPLWSVAVPANGSATLRYRLVPAG